MTLVFVKRTCNLAGVRDAADKLEASMKILDEIKSYIFQDEKDLLRL